MNEKSPEIQQLKDNVVLVDRGTGEVVNWKQTPKEILIQAADAAKALKEMIAQNQKPPLLFNGEPYLEYSHWQTIGKFFHCTAATEDAIFVEIDGHKGFKAKGFVIDERTGLVVGRAEAYCMDDEEKWRARPQYRTSRSTGNREQVGEKPVPLFQLASMAQTRAAAKGLANKFRYVAVLAGYQPTPAEEMTGVPETHSAKEPVKAPQAKAAAPAPAPVAAPVAKPARPQPTDLVSEDDQIKLFAALKAAGIPNDVMKRFMAKQFQVEKTSQLTKVQLAAIFEWLAHFGKTGK